MVISIFTFSHNVVYLVLAQIQIFVPCLDKSCMLSFETDIFTTGIYGLVHDALRLWLKSVEFLLNG